ncbi:hypothetical protein [Nitrosarchaeum sp.]|nr:hypothetical protein [Nitrosarchaeum sp.]MCV0413206.1 hypothetical protein [Nitrosarchaeum sp.]
MNNNIQTQKSISTWDMMVHAPIKKVVKFGLICTGIGVVIGIGLGAFIVLEMPGVL